MGTTEPTAVTAVRRRYDVPTAIRLRRERGETLAFLPEHEVAARAVAARPEALPLAGVGGRAALRRIESDGGPLLAREYRKGGLLRAVRGRRFWGSWRPLEELVLHRRLRALGVPVADAVGCVVLTRGPRWRGFLLVREIRDAVDLEAWFHRNLDAAQRRPVLEAAGRAVRSLHDAGVAHADLHPKNLLLVGDGRVLVLDLDRARPSDGRLEDRARLANLSRLGRAVAKHRLKGLRMGARDHLRFLEGYAGSRGAARSWLERIRADLRRGLPLRTAWWRLMGEARPWASPGGRA